MKAYMFLTISILSELFGTTMLKLSEGFTILFPSLGVILGYGLSFYFLGLTLKTLPLSLAYAIWSGVGTALTTIISVILWNEVLGVLKVMGILFIIGGVVVLNTAENTETATEPSD